MSAAIDKALRAIADTAYDAVRSREDMTPSHDRAVRDAAELARVLARIISGKSIYQAFGAPGDWGYETQIGQALYALYSQTDGAASKRMAA